MAEAATLTEREGWGLATVMARKGVGADAIGNALGLALADGPGWTGDTRLMMIGTGPGSWLAHADAAGDPSGEGALADSLSHKLAGLASVSDQSSGYRIFRLAGPRARDLLQRGAFIDLHPDRFARGSSAVTVIAHVGVILWQVEDDAVYDMAVFRSYADSFLHWFASAKAAL